MKGHSSQKINWLYGDVECSWCLQASGAGRREGHEYLFKVLIIGELGTGKTSIIKRYVHQFFSEHYRATVSFAQL